MLTEKEEEAAIRNSKLSMSIKPFHVNREDLTKSKSVDKSKKAGISRVNCIHQLAPLNPNMKRSQTYSKIHSTTLLNNYNQTNPNWGFGDRYESRHVSRQDNKHEEKLWDRHENRQENGGDTNNLKNDLNDGIIDNETMTLEKENLEVRSTLNEWKVKCEKLYELNEKFGVSVGELERQLSLKSNECIGQSKVIENMEEQIREKEKEIEDKSTQINSLSNIIKQKESQILHQFENNNEETIHNLNNQLRQLTTQLQHKTTQIMQLQESNLSFKASQAPTHTEHTAHTVTFRKSIESVEMSEKETKLLIEQLKEEKFQATESYRQLLIKASITQEEKEELESKISILKYQQEADELRFIEVSQQCEILTKTVLKMEQEIKESAEMKIKLQNMHSLQDYNEILLREIGEKEKKILDLEERRLNQVEFHQQELRRIANNQSNKANESCKELERVLEELGRVKEEKCMWELNKNKMVKEMNREYEMIVCELKDKLEKVEREKSSIDLVTNRIVQEKDTEINDLMSKLDDIKTDNNFLMSKINSAKVARSASVGAINIDQYKSYSRSPLKENNIVSYESHKMTSFSPTIKGLSQYHGTEFNNKELSLKISDLEEENVRLMEMTGVMKKEKESFLKKVESLIESNSYLEKDLMKLIEEKTYLLEEIQRLETMAKNREFEYENLSEKYDRCLLNLDLYHKNETSHKMSIKNLEKEVAQFQQVSKTIDYEKEKLEKKYLETLQLLEKSSSESIAKQSEIEKYQECISLLKEEQKIGKEKEAVKMYLSKREDRSEKEERFTIYDNLIRVLAIQLDTQNLSEFQVLEIITKAVQFNAEKCIDLKMKISKWEQEYSSICQSEIDSRTLAKTFEEKCIETEGLLLRMEDAHNAKIALVKKDYDILYAKYLKYKNMVLSKNQ